MKNILMATTIVAVLSPVVAYADPSGYIEGNIGYLNSNSVDTKTYSGSASGITATNLKGTLDYDSNVSFGVELGAKDIITPNLRLGVSFTTVNLDLNKATINGTLSNGTTTYTGPVTVTAANLASVGLDFNNRINLYMVNAYYDFKNASEFTPFVGAGIGIADISNAKSNELALSLSAGLKYNITKEVYVGAKGTYFRINGPQDAIGIEYDSFGAYSASALVGFEF